MNDLTWCLLIAGIFALSLVIIFTIASRSPKDIKEDEIDGWY